MKHVIFLQILKEHTGTALNDLGWIARLWVKNFSMLSWRKQNLNNTFTIWKNSFFIIYRKSTFWGKREDSINEKVSSVWKRIEFIQIIRKAELDQTKVHLVPLAKLIKGELQCFADCHAWTTFFHYLHSKTLIAFAS